MHNQTSQGLRNAAIGSFFLLLGILIGYGIGYGAGWSRGRHEALSSGAPANSPGSSAVTETDPWHER